MKAVLFISYVTLISFYSAYAQTSDLISISEQLGLDGYYFSTVCEDQQGYIWTGTGNNGLFKIVGNATKHYVHDPADNSSLFSGFIHSLELDQEGRIWVGARTGLNIIYPEHDSIIRVKFDLNLISPYCPRVYSMTPDHQGGYWIGSGCGLLHVDNEFNLIDQFPVIPHFHNSEYDENVLYCVVKDKFDSDRLWIGTRCGLKSFSQKSQTFTTYVNPKKWHNYFPKAQQYAFMDIIQISETELWLSALWSGGILKFNPTNQNWDQYLFPKSDPTNPRPGNQMHSLSIHNDTLLLFGNNVGYGFFNRLSATYEPLNQVEYGTDQGFYNQHTDAFGYVWIAGLSRLLKSSHPIALNRNCKTHAPQIESISVNETIRALPKENKIVLDIDSNDIYIRLYSINYPLPYEHNLRYKIKELDSDWKYYSGQQQIRYSNLPLGNYSLLFEIRDYEHTEKWIKGEPFAIQIHQAFYRSNWFRGCVVVSLGLLLYLFMQYRIKGIKRREKIKSEYERQLAEIKMSALNSQMNPHFLFNTMNSINHFILKNESDKASHYLTRFSRLIRQILHNSRQNLVTLEDELNAMNLYIEMEQMRFDDGFEYKLYVDPALNQESITIPPMIMQPYIENAIWHGLLNKDSDRQLSIHIEKDVSNLSISIRDNGIGREATLSHKSGYSAKRNSVGMSITKDRIELANRLYNTSADVEVIDLKNGAQATGTEVILSIPITYTDPTASI